MPAFNPTAFDAVAPGLIADLISRDGLSPTEAAAATDDYRRFLALVADDRPTCPPSLADKAWHRHMEQPAYADQIVELCGRPLSHNKDVFGTAEFAAAWADTRARWAAAYGQELDPDPTNADGGRHSSAACSEMSKADSGRYSPAACSEMPKADCGRYSPAACSEMP